MKIKHKSVYLNVKSEMLSRIKIKIESFQISVKHSLERVLSFSKFNENSKKKKKIWRQIN